MKLTGMELVFFLALAFGLGMGVGLVASKEVATKTATNVELFFQYDGKLYELKEADALEQKKILMIQESYE
jgi:demethoxyubiquinone hydroxylase (CLK1/Coq7/Cat5 family)